MNRYPLQTVIDMERCSMQEMAERTGISRRTLQRWKADGLTYAQADRLAVALRTLPYRIWPEWLDHAIEQERRQRTERDRPKYQRYRERHREAVNARRMDWYRANRERVLAQLRTPEARAKAAAYKRAWRARRSSIESMEEAS